VSLMFQQRTGDDVPELKNFIARAVFRPFLTRKARLSEKFWRAMFCPIAGQNPNWLAVADGTSPDYDAATGAWIETAKAGE
jgi:hypothetical protein